MTYDVIIETSGNPDAIGGSLHKLEPSGRLILIGQPKFHERSMIYPLSLFEGEGKIIKATQGGRFNPTRDIPRYLAMFRKQPGLIEGIVTHRVKLKDINSGLDLVRNGEAGRVLVEMK